MCFHKSKENENEMIKYVCFVGLGGALGAMTRFLFSLIPNKMTFPIITFSVNLLGAILIGLIVGLSAAKGFPKGWLLFWQTGFCGGFTTFSTFSLDNFRLFREGKAGKAAANIFMNLALGIGAAALGFMLFGEAV